MHTATGLGTGGDGRVVAVRTTAGELSASAVLGRPFERVCRQRTRHMARHDLVGDTPHSPLAR